MTPFIFNVKIDDLPTNELIKIVHALIDNNEKASVNNVNIQALNISYHLPWFRHFLNDSKITFCDGFGVILASRILGFNLKNRNTPPDWMASLAQTYVLNRNTIGLIGSRPGIAEKAARILQEQAPGSEIVFTHHGYFDKSPGHPENEAVISSINQASPDILFVGFGMPMQEKWIMENFDRLNVKVFLPVGAAFDYISGNVPRAPRWMTDHGLEWLGRLIIEPRRLWKRYLIGIPLFYFRVLKQKFGLLKLPD
jgi:N-acetylglucosaminyldiphosphoundecaprenol N-acetyl-beta-D-mannosaminyltransferase